MGWNEEKTSNLLSFTTNIDYDNIKVKEKIKQVILNNEYIIHVLNNKELEDAESEPDEYYGTNILPYYLIYDTQTNVQNYICYEVNYDEMMRYNNYSKRLEIVFHILCQQANIIDEETQIPRHDLLAALIQDQFNYTNYFGQKIQLVSDVSSTVDSKFACRTLIFEQITDNNLVKTRNNIPKLANKDVVTGN